MKRFAFLFLLIFPVGCGGSGGPGDAGGVTEALPAPDPDHAHQLKVLRIR